MYICTYMYVYMTNSFSMRAVMQFFVGAGHGTLAAAKTIYYTFLSATSYRYMYVCMYIYAEICLSVCALCKYYTNIFI